MKFQHSILIFILCISSLLASNTPSSIALSQRAITVKASEWASKNVNIRIFDQNGQNIFSEEVQDLNLDRRYNLSHLALGQYEIEISSDVKTFQHRFIIHSENIALLGEEQLLFKPMINAYDNTLDFNMMALNKPVSVQIRDKNENILLNQTYVDMVIQKRFNISKLLPGEYLMSIQSEGKFYYQTIKKD